MSSISGHILRSGTIIPCRTLERSANEPANHGLNRVDALDSPSTSPDSERSRPTTLESRNEENKSEIRSADPTNLMNIPKPHSNKAESILSSRRARVFMQCMFLSVRRNATLFWI